MIEYSQDVTSDRLRALTRALDNHPTLGGQLLSYSGVRPSRGAVPTGGSVQLAVSTFPRPSLLDVVDSTLTLNNPPAVLVQNNGVATWARLVDGGGAFVADMDMGVTGAEEVVVLGTDGLPALTAQLYAGGMLSVAIVTLEEPL